jgi:hypothetical protein
MKEEKVKKEVKEETKTTEDALKDKIRDTIDFLDKQSEKINVVVNKLIDNADKEKSELSEPKPEKTIKIEEGGRYLLKPRDCDGHLIEIVVEEISNFAVKIRFKPTNNIVWMLRKDIIATYKVVETLFTPVYKILSVSIC